MNHFIHRRTLPDGTIKEISGTYASTPDLPPFPKPDPEPPIGGGVVLPKKPGGDDGGIAEAIDHLHSLMISQSMIPAELLDQSAISNVKAHCNELVPEN